MYTLVCATHRPENKTLGILNTYRKILEEKGVEVDELDMGDLPDDFIASDGFGKRSEVVEKLIAEKLKPAEKIIVVAPEYNGSFPGIFKTFIDAVQPDVFYGKKAALVGVASGRAGNLRGLDHLTDVLHHLQVEVLSLKVPISKLHEMTNEHDELVDIDSLNALNNQADKLIKF